MGCRPSHPAQSGNKKILGGKFWYQTGTVTNFKKYSLRPNKHCRHFGKLPLTEEGFLQLCSLGVGRGFENRQFCNTTNVHNEGLERVTYLPKPKQTARCWHWEYPYLVQETPSFPPCPRLTILLHKFSMVTGHSALGDSASSWFFGSAQQGAAGNALICRFNFLRAATASLHLWKRRQTDHMNWLFCRPDRLLVLALQTGGGSRTPCRSQSAQRTV